MKALMISRDASLHDEIAAQGAARMPVLRLLERRSGLRDAVERMLPEAPELVIVDASGIDADEA
ncbi:MAG: response regulator receiver protein, partial [Janthinobacterium sp.]